MRACATILSLSSAHNSSCVCVCVSMQIKFGSFEEVVFQSKVRIIKNRERMLSLCKKRINKRKKKKKVMVNVKLDQYFCLIS